MHAKLPGERVHASDPERACGASARTIGPTGEREGGGPSGWTARVIIDSYVASAHTELATLRTQIKRELTGPGREALTGLGSGPQATRRHDQVCYYGVRLWSAH